MTWKSFLDIKHEMNQIIAGDDPSLSGQKKKFLGIDSNFHDVINKALDELDSDPALKDFDPSANEYETYRILSTKILSRTLSPRVASEVADLVAETTVSQNVSLDNNLKLMIDMINKDRKEKEEEEEA